MSFHLSITPLCRSVFAFLLLGLVASPRPQNTVLVRLDRREATGPSDRLGSQIEVLQELRTCLIARMPAGAAGELAARGIRMEVLDAAPAGKAYFLVHHSDVDQLDTLSAYGVARRLEEGTFLFWTDAENVREILPPGFRIKRLPATTPRRLGRTAFPSRFERPRAEIQNPSIVQMVSEVSRDNLAGIVETLQDFRTRYASTSNCEAAGDYLYAYFESLGLAPRFETISFGVANDRQSRNIVAELPGRTSPEYSVVLCAHYDSYSTQPQIAAPGADDNASGTAAIIEIARILAQSSFDFTIRFICLSAEEWGLYGSSQYAIAARQRGEKIAAVVNLDMVGYADSVPEDLEIIGNPESEWLLSRFAAAAADYTALQVAPRVDASFWKSDHSSFWDQGYSAICGIEDLPLTNPYYHRTWDTLDTLNLGFLTSVTQATLAAAADLAGSAGIQSHLAHIPNGGFDEGSYRTTFVLFNNTDKDTLAHLRLTRDDGRSLPLTIPALGTGSDFTVALAPGATRILETDGSGSLATGAATVTCESPIGLSAIFSIYDAAGHFSTEAGVGVSPPLAEFMIPVETTGGFNTGLALYNPSAAAASLVLTLLDEKGTETGLTSLAIPPGAHLARFVAGPGQLFPSTEAMRGTLAVHSDVPIAALALRQNAARLSYTSLPVLDSNHLRHSSILPHVANGFYGSGSFRTSFLILNPSSASAKISMSMTQSGGAPLQATLSGYGTGSSFDFELGPYASLFLQTDGSGSLSAGAATILSDVPVGAFAIFSVFDAQGRFQTEAGVGAVNETASFTLPVDLAGDFDTGVAIFNARGSPAQLTLCLMDEGGEKSDAKTGFTLPAWNHSAKFVSELFPGRGGFRGSLAVSGGTVVALALRQKSSPLSYTTLPVKEGISSGKVSTR